MKIKNISIILLVLTLMLFFLLVCFNDSKRLSDLNVTNEEWNDIIKERKETKKDLLIYIKFNDYKLFFDKTKNSWFYSIIDSSKSKYNPYIKYGSYKNAKIAFKNIEINDDLIGNNKSLEFIVYNDNEYRIYTIICTLLPLMNINYDFDNDITNNAANMKMELFDNRKNASQRTIKSSGKIKTRGSTAKLYPKKSYNISLDQISLGNNKRDNNISLLGMRKDDDWILYAAYNDQEKVGNIFASNLWFESCADDNKFNIKNGMEYKYIELFINNEYWGIYALGFPIDSKQLRIDKDEYIFKKIGWDSSEVNDLNTTITMSGYEMKGHSKNQNDGWKILKNYYITLRNSKNVNELYNVSDIDNVIDYYLFNNFIQGYDNPNGMSLKNVFISFKKYKNNYVALYTPWDMDFTFGNLWIDSPNANLTKKYSIDPTENVIFQLNSIYYLQQLNDKNIDKLIKEKYKKLRSDGWSEMKIDMIIDKLENDIYNSGAFLRDKSRWPNGNYNNAEERLGRFKEYIHERLRYLDKYVEEL